MITIKIAQIPGALQEFVVENGTTVSEALDTADRSADGFSVTVNGGRASMDQTLRDGDNIVLSKAAKGNG